MDPTISQDNGQFSVTCYRKVSKIYNLQRNAQKSFCKGGHFPKRVTSGLVSALGLYPPPTHLT